MKQKYYKIVALNYPFLEMLSEHYNINDINNITSNIDIINKSSTIGRFCIHFQKPVIHFTDNAFDTILWDTIFDEKSVIYEIQPTEPIIKEKCKDRFNLYQCGSTSIKIIKKVPTIVLIYRGIKEYYSNKTKNNYSNIHSMICLYLIQKFLKKIQRD
ncbi:MAG: hypothetical protein IKZ49_01920 [Alphaproteobacteria bacterium]|nr:hypothetical protein [Alphaproteobacteria bacterium]